MINVYHPGDTIFLYTTFETGLNIISSRNETVNSREVSSSLKNYANGIIINGQYVSYESYMYNYATDYSYLIDTTPYDTYYVYNTYYYGNTLNASTNVFSSRYHYNVTTEPNPILPLPNIDDTSEDNNQSGQSSNIDTIGEELKEADIIEVISHSISVRILHDMDGEIYEDLEWTPLKKLSTNEFYYNFCIPYTFTPGQYQVIYKSTYSVKYFSTKTKQQLTDDELDKINFNKYNKTKVAYAKESFYVIVHNDIYENVIKVFGTVNYAKSTIPAEDVRISVYELSNQQQEKKIYQSLTERDGTWEVYVYPGQYRFNFYRRGYLEENIYATISDDAQQQPFENVALTNGDSSQGTGIFKIFDNYHTKNGQPINGLTVQAFDILNPTVSIATDVTNDKGFWELFLNEGTYLLKVRGYFNNIDFGRTFRLKVLQNGEWHFEGLNITLTDADINNINRGSGQFKIKDVLIDRFNNPIGEIQVNIFPATAANLNDESIIAQDYSDGNGEYIVYLDPGTYIFEYYHPNFATYTVVKTVDNNGQVTELKQSSSSSSERSVSDNTKVSYDNYNDLINAINNGILQNLTAQNINQTTTQISSNQSNISQSINQSTSLYNTYLSNVRIR